MKVALARKKKPLNSSGFIACVCRGLLHDLDDATCPWVDQHRLIVDDGVSIIANAVVRRNVIIGDACFGKYRAYPDIAFVTIGGPMFFDDIAMEPRTCIHAKDAGDTPDNPANCATYNSAYWACGPFPISSSAVDAFGHSLG